MWTAIIGAVVAAIGSIVATTMSVRGQREANKANIELAKQSHEADLATLDKVNEYNSPQQQIERLKAAGLNPNLVYGSGNSVGLSPLPPKTTTASVLNPYAGFGKLDLGSAFSTYQDLSLQSARVDNEKTRNSVLAADTLLKAANTSLSETRKDLVKSQMRNVTSHSLLNELQYKKQLELYKTQIDAQKTSLNLLKSQAKKAAVDSSVSEILKSFTIEKGVKDSVSAGYKARKDKLEYEFLREMRALGLGTNDPWYIRGLAKLFSEFNLRSNTLTLPNKK